MSVGEPKMLSPEEMAKIKEDRIESNKEFIIGGAELSDENQIVATNEQIASSKDLMETVLKSKNRISEIKKTLENFTTESNSDLEFKALSLEFTELWKFLNNEKENIDSVAEEIDAIKIMLWDIKEEMESTKEKIVSEGLILSEHFPPLGVKVKMKGDKVVEFLEDVNQEGFISYNDDNFKKALMSLDQAGVKYEYEPWHSADGEDYDGYLNIKKEDFNKAINSGKLKISIVSDEYNDNELIIEN